jgi:class 3 adenylate cyclase/tetratricopeptide (TPR) repeat protein
LTICPRCNTENREGRRFCSECGLSFAAACPSCGFLNEGGEKFCGGCGRSLTATPRVVEPQFGSPRTYTPKHLAEKILTSKAALEGERKQVTVLFADLKGSMELLADRDPEEARKILDPVLERMMEAVHRYEGTVNQVMGDGIMALFGAPLAHEDHAVRACYAALRMQETVKKYADELRRVEGLPVRIRLGLNSGEVVVRSIRSDLHMDYTAVGQTTHLAARMEQMADPGAILITADTLRLAEGFIEAQSLGPVSVKGLAVPVETFALTGAGSARSRFHVSAARGLTRFVGREAEIGALLEALEQVRSGHGQVVAVVGEPGVGKSRLSREVLASLQVQGWVTLEAASASYGKATGFGPVIELLRIYFQIEPRDDARRIREKVTGKILFLDRALEPDLAAVLWLLAVPSDDPAWDRLGPPERRQKTLDAVKRLLIRESHVQPLLVLFEDTHWIDGETQAFLDTFVESVPAARVLLLVNYRPEYRHPWSGKSHYCELRIDPLPPASAAELLDALLGHDASLEPLKRLLVARADGNPFFLEESVRTLIETKVLVGERGVRSLSRAPTDLEHKVEIPATVQAMLAGRIDRLSREDKRLLQAAAVIGQEVPLALLLAIAGEPQDTVRGRLARLQAAEFLHETRLFPDLEYTFRHALTHEVVYEGLLHDRRRQLHAAIVEAMEDHHADRLSEHAERLAHHAVRGALWEKAVTHLWQAGRNARGRSAYHEATMFLEQAVEALTRLPDTVEHTVLHIDLVCHDLSDTLNILARYERLLEHLNDAARLAERIGDRARLASALARLLRPLRVSGQSERAVQIGERACVLAAEVGDATLNALAHMELGSVHYVRGDARRAEALLTQALAALEPDTPGRGEIDGAWVRRMVCQNLVRVLAETGRYRDAIRRGEETLSMAEELGHPAPIAWALCYLGYAYCGRGDADQAIDLSERSLTLARERDVRNLIPEGLTCLGAAYTLAGRATEAVACLEASVETGRSTSRMELLTLVSLARAYLSAGRQDDAIRHAREALAACRERTARNFEASALHLHGDIAAGLEPPSLEEAERLYRQALALAEELGMRPLVAHCHLGLGKLYRRPGKREQAQEHLTTATTMYREMGMTYWLEEAEAKVKELVVG